MSPTRVTESSTRVVAFGASATVAVLAANCNEFGVGVGVAVGVGVGVAVGVGVGVAVGVGVGVAVGVGVGVGVGEDMMPVKKSVLSPFKFVPPWGFGLKSQPTFEAVT